MIVVLPWKSRPVLQVTQPVFNGGVGCGGVGGGGGGGASTSSGERTGRTKTVERFVFHFDIDGVIGNSSGCSNILGSRGSTDGDKRMQSSKIIDIEDMKPQKSAIEIDADLATVWTPYQFYYQEKFSHCGVNTFTLVRQKGEWKINYIIDTRRKDNCN